MNKATIEKFAIDRFAAQQEREGKFPREVVISPESVSALSGAIVSGIRAALIEVGPILARLAAADTTHTVDRPPKVFAQALIEAQTASAVLVRAGVAK